MATGSIFDVDDSLSPIHPLQTHFCAKDDRTAFHNDLQSY
jgi:hypothetical protein